MKRTGYFKKLFIAACGCTLLSCSENNDMETYEPQTYSVDGKVEKGPFVSGSAITMQPMNAQMQASGATYSATILDNAGNFTFGSQLLDAPFATLTANGYFYNEVRGNLSAGVLNLKAVADLSDRSTLNVNILTHLKYPRILHLVAKGSTFKAANEQAQNELFAAFGLSEYAQTDAAQLSIVGGNEEAAALIAVSSLLLADRSEAELTEYLAGLSLEFGQNGRFSAETQEQLKNDRRWLQYRLPYIKEGIVRRYAELGQTVDVKDLAPFFDWDDNGIAGDEILKEGEKVTIETTRIEIPNGGGSYRIKITSPIRLYLEPANGSINDNVTTEPLLRDLYKDAQGQEISIEKQLDNNTLTINVPALKSRADRTQSVHLYDCLGNVLGTVELLQAGDRNAPLPLLGNDAKGVLNNMMLTLSKALAASCQLEQYYHYNRQTDWVAQRIYPASSTISNCWGAFYNFNLMSLTFKKIDSEQLSVWQHLFNLFSALQYYYLTTAWGGVPYITDYDWYQGIPRDLARTEAETILNALQGNLERILPLLDDKKNESLKDSDGAFFMSKDVARFLLANICMNRQEYGSAAVWLQEIINGGFYRLDASDYSEEETIERIRNKQGGKEILFALYADASATEAAPESVVRIPSVLPLQTYTDVVLSYAECLYKQGNEAEAGNQLRRVAEAKNIAVGDKVWDGIVEARKRLLLYCNSNFAFMKRNGIAREEYGVEAYRLLWPIPQTEIYTNSQMTQNPGYEKKQE